MSKVLQFPGCCLVVLLLLFLFSGCASKGSSGGEAVSLKASADHSVSPKQKRTAGQSGELKQKRSTKKRVERKKTVQAQPAARAAVGRAGQRNSSTTVRKGAEQKGLGSSLSAAASVDPDASEPSGLGELSVEIADPGAGGATVVGRMLFYYDFYPEADVYFDTVRHLYFYYDAGRWIMSVALPSQIQSQLGRSERLTLSDSLPYLRHQENKSRY